MVTKSTKVMFMMSCLFVAACTSQPKTLKPSPLNPAPVAPVSSTALPPAGIPGQVAGLPNGPATGPGGYTPPGSSVPAGDDLQAIPQLPSANTGVTQGGNVTVSPDIDFGRNAVLGAWNASAEADTCALNLSLTTWTGGFRASTRKCTSVTLVSIGAWALNGKQLILSNAQGTPIARLVASGPNRFDGTTEVGGKAISVFR